MIFEDIASSILSITFKTLLYLNLPPNLLSSTDFAYVVNPLIILVFKLETVDTFERS